MMDHIVRHMPGNYNEIRIGFYNLKYNWTVIRRYLRGIYQLVKKEISTIVSIYGTKRLKLFCLIHTSLSLHL